MGRKTLGLGKPLGGHLAAKVAPGEQGLLVLESLFVRNCQFLAALLPSGSQYSATVSRSHSLAKTMLVLSFPA